VSKITMCRGVAEVVLAMRFVFLGMIDFGKG
jgi:hypothetical protein